jgi:hypothetical protein
MIILQISEEQLRDIIRQELNKPTVTTSAPEPQIKGIVGLSEFLKVSHSRAQAIKNSGIIPFFQTGRLILFDPATVRKVMAEYSKRDRRRK